MMSSPCRLLVLLTVLLARAAGADNPPNCVTAPKLMCRAASTVSGRLVAFADTTGGVNNSCTATCSGGTIGAAITGNATTATALAANGTNCASGNFPLGVDAAGSAESCASSIAGNAATATALAANPGDCPAGQYATTIAASGALTCQAVPFSDLSGAATDAQVPDAISVYGVNSCDVRRYTADCTGAADSTTGINNALAACAGGSIFLPAACKLRLASPGAGNVSVTVPTGTSIICENATAGFLADVKACVGGTYAGAACSTNSDCNWCSGCGAATCAGSQYAPTGGSLYTMFKDNGGTGPSSNIAIEQCGFWTGQADLYQRCSGGSFNGKPCDQKCDAASGAFAGFRCEVSATHCGAGTCLNTVDCAAGGGTCGGAPGAPSGAGKIDVVNLAKTTFVSIHESNVYDHFRGTNGIKTGQSAQIRETNVARESNDCFEPASPGVQGAACYGAINFWSSNTQPTTAVDRGIEVDHYSQVSNSTSRGSVYGFLGGAGARLDENALAGGGSGPGTATTGIGYEVAANGVVAKSMALAMGASSIGVKLNGAGASAIETRIGGSFSTGILISGASAHAIGNNITGVTGAAYGIEAAGPYGYVGGNYVEGNSSGAGIRVNAADATVQGNQIVSSAVNTLDTGIQVEAFQHPIITDNQIRNVELYGVWLKGASWNFKITANNIVLTAAVTAALKPQHIMDDGLSQQGAINGNFFYFGWRGFSTGTAVGFGLTNTLVTNNRFVGLSGAELAAGGAGIQFAGNYSNPQSLVAATYCDMSCTGSRGIYCTTDADCSGCSSARACLPEPTVGFIGAPMAVVGATHNAIINNVIFDGRGDQKQCSGGTGSPNTGQLCTTPGNTCATGSCTGTPAKCASGTDIGKLCCTGTSPTCAVRDIAPLVRVAEYESANGSDVQTIVGNVVLAANGNTAFIDAVGSGSLGNLVLKNWIVSGNALTSASATNTTAFKFPTTFNTVSGNAISANTFVGWSTNIANWQHAFGAMELPNTLFLSGRGTTLGTSGTVYFPIHEAATATGTESTVQTFVAPQAGRVWSGNCWVSAAPGASKSRDFTWSKNTTAQALTINISGASTQVGAPTAGANSAGFDFAAGDKITIKSVANSTPAAADGYCTTQLSYGAF